jgi:hypothetical protein
MLIVSFLSLLGIDRIEFPIRLWLPWIAYLVIYLIIDFSFLGLQLTLQYTLPILVGVVASGFNYYFEDLRWLSKWFIGLCVAIFVMFLIGYFFKDGYTPASAATPMILSIAISLLTSLWFFTKIKRLLLYIGIFFLAPVLDVTRMGIAATGAVFILHFANRNLRSKVLYGIIGLLVLFIIFNTKGFQEKTFIAGQGTLADLTFNYYDNPNINNNGRNSWKEALQPGLDAAPFWGNGPRSDNAYLTDITGLKAGEAHNDFLSVRHNYGYFGLILLLFGFFSTFFSIYRISLSYYDKEIMWVISTTVLTLFISFFMFMYSDNILKYTIYFPNYFFALIGVVYSLKRYEDISRCYTVQ